MPRTLQYDRYWTRVLEHQRRLNPGVEAAWQLENPVPAFIDYWPEVPATLPEKMVFAELVRRRVNFAFSYYWGDMPFTLDKEEHYRPDFTLLDYRIILEVFGVYWHTRPGMFEYDSTKLGLYIASGWSPRVILDVDILSNVASALDEAVPELRTLDLHGDLHIVGDRPFDPNAAITGRMRRYPKQFVTRYRKRVPSHNYVQSSWQANRKPTRPQPASGPIVTALDADFRKAYHDYGQEWKAWLDSLGEYFTQYPKAKTTYAAEWELYQQWKDWWDRYLI